MPDTLYVLRPAIVWVLLSLTGCHTQAPTPVTHKAAGEQHARGLVSTLPVDDLLRRFVDGGRIGDGTHYPWMDQMKRLGVKQARIVVYMTWFFGPRQMKPVRVTYYTDYSFDAPQITDEQHLRELMSSGLEDAIKTEALRYAPHGAWIDLPHSIFRPFRAATTIILFDDEWLPVLPHMYTTFGPERPPLIAAIGENDEADVIHLLNGGKLSKAEVDDALFWACNEHEIPILKHLIDAGADVNLRSENTTPLMVAITWKSSRAVNLLLGAGAKVNGPQDQYGETPLTWAAQSGPEAEPLVRTLLENGAEVNASNGFGITALMRATHRAAPSVLTALIRRGADVNAQDHDGRTALMFASEYGNLEAVKILLAAHPDISKKNNQGKTALSVAKGPTADLLQQASAAH
jgi:ankyrin repeat protein